MPRPKPKPESSPPSPTPVANGPPAEVLTLAEAVAYLRLPEAGVLRLVDEQGLPARQLGTEWRLLKAAIQDWLRSGPPPRPGKEAQLAVAGSWKDVPYVDEELKEIDRGRGRPMIEDES
jgi:excisionase family DNA binding protein